MSTLSEKEKLKAQLEVVIQDNHWFTQRQIDEVLNGERPVEEFRQWQCLVCVIVDGFQLFVTGVNITVHSLNDAEP